MLRGSLRILFKLKSIDHFLHYIFRLQQFFNIFLSSDFAHIPYLNFPMDVVHNGGKSLSIFVSSLRNREASFGDHLKKGSNFEQRERKYANTWGGGGRACGQKTLQKYFHCIFLYLQKFGSTVSTFMRLESCNLTLYSQFYDSQDRNKFCFFF